MTTDNFNCISNSLDFPNFIGINSGYVNYFDNIVEIDPSAIKGVTMDKKRNASIYNLNGVKLNEVHKGINVIGGKKVVIR